MFMPAVETRTDATALPFRTGTLTWLSRVGEIRSCARYIEDHADRSDGSCGLALQDILGRVHRQGNGEAHRGGRKF